MLFATCACAMRMHMCVGAARVNTPPLTLPAPTFPLLCDPPPQIMLGVPRGFVNLDRSQVLELKCCEHIIETIEAATQGGRVSKSAGAVTDRPTFEELELKFKKLGESETQRKKALPMSVAAARGAAP